MAGLARPSGWMLLVAALLSSLFANLAVAAELGRIASWSTPTSTELERPWGSALLNSTILNWGNLFQAHHLLEKLNAGKPITVTAIGSSMVADTAGCFQASTADLWQFPGVIPNPTIYTPQGTDNNQDASDFSVERCKGGFMTTFMENINRTSASLDSIAKAGCIGAHVPDDVDMVLLDPASIPCHVESLEQLVRLFLRKASKPLVIVLSFHHAVSRIMNGPRPQETPEDTPLGELAWPPGEDTWARVEMITQFYEDHVHLRKERYGVMLMADVILHYLWAAQERLKSMADAQRTALQYDLSKVSVFKAISRSYLQRCYGTNFKQVLSEMDKNTSNAGDASEAERIKSTIHTIGPGGHFAGFGQDFVTGANDPNGDDEQTHVLYLYCVMAFRAAGSTPDIVSMEGWTMQAAYTAPSGEIKLKPGWLGKDPGARLVFQVNTVWPGVDTVGNPEILITYVKSYAGWGQVLVSCGNCLCGNTVLDAHWDTKCQVSLTVLGTTSSSGHMWKLVHVLARIEENMVPSNRNATSPATRRRMLSSHRSEHATLHRVRQDISSSRVV